MTASNHALTGAIIVLTIDKPVLALPLALASHFALDVLPHFGNYDRAPHNSRLFMMILVADAAIAVSVMLAIYTFLPVIWLSAVAGSLLAMAPDLMWAPGYIRGLTRQEQSRPNAIMRWHKRIQWQERPWGFFIEIIWFVGGLALLFVSMARHI